jgi:hypothetical protein
MKIDTCKSDLHSEVAILELQTTNSENLSWFSSVTTITCEKYLNGLFLLNSLASTASNQTTTQRETEFNSKLSDLLIHFN